MGSFLNDKKFLDLEIFHKNTAKDKDCWFHIDRSGKESYKNRLSSIEQFYQLDHTLSIKLFSLYVTEEELRRRLDLRSDPEFRDFEICKRLNNDLLKIKYHEEHQIDTTGL